MVNDRQKNIINYLKLNNLVTVEELVSACEASPATIRRDLIKLDEEGLIYRVHGGVTLNRETPQPTTIEKQKHHQKEKIAIAKEACKLIKPNQAIVLDAGTTTMGIARNIIALPLRVITPDLHIGMMLAEYQQIDVSLTGGHVDWSSQSCIGAQTINILSKLHPNYTFLSCNAFSLESGITAPTQEKALIKTTMLKQSSKCILVADSSKYGLSQLYEVGSLSELDMIITDKNLDAKVCDEIKNLGIELILC